MKSIGICIPTYKRPSLLKVCVSSILGQVCLDGVKIYVTDDSCDSTNELVMRELMEKTDRIVYIKNERNLGIDKNIQKSIDVCDCDYAWPLGEDDVLLPGAIERIKSIAESFSPDFIYTNYVYVSNDYQAVLGGPDFSGESRAIEPKDFFSSQIWKIGFIGACVISMRSWKSASVTPYIGTYFAHVGRIMESLAASGRIYMQKEPCVGNRADGFESFTWGDKFYDVFFGCERMVRTLAERNPAYRTGLASALSLIEYSFKYKTIRQAVLMRARGVYSAEIFRRYFVSGTPASKKVTLFLVACCPAVICRLTVWLFKKAKGMI